ncbi:MAG: PorP/SprF family type IX secretion system membrane protein [Bacteroidia bacterium]|nr:PorP/SprF family type IX secretion system membrane protein [Bacteroidia bacterium]
MKYLYIGCCFFMSINLFSQQELLFTNDRYNILTFNPAISGVFDDNTYAKANVSYRNQWQGFDGAPLTINGGFEYLIEDKNIGLGFTIYNDQIGIDSKFEIAGNYAYHMKTRDGKLSGGIRTALTQFYSDFDAIVNVEAGDIYDDANQSFSVFSVGIGVIYAEENLQFGIAVPNLAAFSKQASFKDFKERHLHLNASFKLGDYTDDFRLEPTMLFKYQPSVPIQVKIGVLFHLGNTITPGIHFRTDDALAFSLGLKLQEQIDIGLAYDLTLSKIRQVSNNTLELFLGYRFYK